MSHPTGVLPEAHKPYNGPERRAYVRYLRLREARVRPDTSPTRIFGVAVIREVSQNGLSLFINARVREGTILEVAPRGVEFTRSLLARVVRVTPQANGWLYGCELANNLSEDELRMLVH